MKWLLLAVIVVATVLGDLLQSYEMKRSGEQSVGARGLARLLRVIASRKFLLLGIACMAVSFFAFMALLSVAEVSFVVPVTALGYVLKAFLAKWYLGEHVSWRRWMGACLVTLGVSLILF